MRARGRVMRRRLSGGCHGNARGKRKSGENRPPRGVPRQNPSPSGRFAAAAPSGCRESMRGRRESGEIRHPRDASRQNPSPSGSLAAAVLSGCRESTRGRRESGENRRPWGTSRQLARRDVTEACKGDGNQPESVTLGAFRGKIRLPRRLTRQNQLLRHLPCGLLKTPVTPPRPNSAFRYHVAHED